MSTEFLNENPTECYEPPLRAPDVGQDPARKPTYAAPPPPQEGQHFVSLGTFWFVKRLTMSDDPVGFYLVTLSHGPTIHTMHESLVLGPQEFAKLVRDRGLKPHP